MVARDVALSAPTRGFGNYETNFQVPRGTTVWKVARDRRGGLIAFLALRVCGMLGILRDSAADSTDAGGGNRGVSWLAAAFGLV
jgi:hypothetical protein